MFQPTIKLLLLKPSLNNQFQLLSKLIRLYSNHTKVVFSTMMLAVIHSTTVLLLLDTVLKTDKNTSLSETHGVLHGEKVDTSELLETIQSKVVSAVLLNKLHTQIKLNQLDLSSLSLNFK
jgi:hypothetical protein